MSSNKNFAAVCWKSFCYEVGGEQNATLLTVGVALALVTLAAAKSK